MSNESTIHLLQSNWSFSVAVSQQQILSNLSKEWKHGPVHWERRKAEADHLLPSWCLCPWMEGPSSLHLVLCLYTPSSEVGTQGTWHRLNPLRMTNTNKRVVATWTEQILIYSTSTQVKSNNFRLIILMVTRTEWHDTFGQQNIFRDKYSAYCGAT